MLSLPSNAPRWANRFIPASALSAVAMILMSAVCSLAAASEGQTRSRPSGIGARAPRFRGNRIRAEAAGYVRWGANAPVDSSHGAATYWLHVAAADRGGRTSGGFILNMPSRAERLHDALT